MPCHAEAQDGELAGPNAAAAQVRRDHRGHVACDVPVRDERDHRTPLSTSVHLPAHGSNSASGAVGVRAISAMRLSERMGNCIDLFSIFVTSKITTIN